MDYLCFVRIVLLLLAAAAAVVRKPTRGWRWILLAGALSFAALLRIWALAWLGRPPAGDLPGVLWAGAASVIALASGLRFRSFRSKTLAIFFPAIVAVLAWLWGGKNCDAIIRWVAWFPSFLFAGAIILFPGDYPKKQIGGRRALGIGLCLLALAGPTPSLEWPDATLDPGGAIAIALSSGLATIACILIFVGIWNLTGQKEDPSAHLDPRRRVREATITAVLAFILAAGWLASELTSQTADTLWKRVLAKNAELAAGGLAPELIAPLQGRKEDELKPSYREIKKRLAMLTVPDGNFLSSYLLAMKGGSVIVLADCWPSHSPDSNPPGSEFSQAPASLHALFKKPQTIILGPNKSGGVTRITVFSPVYGAEFRGSPLILGIDLDADAWHANLGHLRQAAMGVTFLFLLLAVAAFVILDISARSHSRQIASGEQLRISLQGAKLASWEIFPGKGQISLDSAWADLVGTPRERTHLPISAFVEKIHPDDRARFEANLRKIGDHKGQIIEDEFRVRGPGGNTFWLLGRLHRAPQTQAITGFALDISERKASSDLQNLQSAALAAAGNGILICGPDGTIEWANASFEKITGYQLDELAGKKPNILRSGKHERLFYKDLWDTILAGNTWAGEITNRKKDGSLYVDETTITPLLDPSGKITHFIAVKQDITARKNSEAELERRREEAVRLALVAENTTNAVVITNPSGFVEWVNPGFTRITGFSFQEVVGRKPGHLLQGPGTDRAATARVREALASGNPFNETILNYTKFGRPYWISIEGQPLKDESGNLTGFMAIEQDVSARISAEIALDAQRSRIQKINATLLDLGHSYSDNLQKLTTLAGELFGADMALYNRLEGAKLATRGRYKAPADLPHKMLADGHLCFDVIRDPDRFLYIENLFDSPYLQSDPNVKKFSLRTFVGQAVTVNGVALGSLSVVFGKHFTLTEDLRNALAIVAQAIGREELLELNRRKLDGLVKAESEQRSRFSTLLQKLQDAVMVEDAARSITFVNHAMEQMFGLRANDLLGEHVLEVAGRLAGLFVEPDRFRSSLEGRSPDNKAGSPSVFATADGRFLESECVPIRDAGTLHGYLWRFRDTTLEKSTRALLEAIAEIGKNILSQPLEGAGVWEKITASFGTRMSADRLFLHRVEGGDTFDLLADWDAHHDHEGSPPPDGLWGLAARSGCAGIWLESLKAGRHVAISEPAKANPLLAESGLRSFLCVPLRVAGNLWGALSVIYCSGPHIWRDEEIALFETAAELIGSRLTLQLSERQLIEAKDAADAANRAKSTFLATMSHEIRTPLNAVIGMSSLLLETRLEAQQQEYASTVAASAETLLDLINDILDYSKIETGHIEIERAPFNLADCIFEPLEMQARTASARGIELSCSIDPALPEFVEGDRTRLKQVILNLTSNALKFTAEGQVEVSAEAGEGDSLRVKIRDTGIGISPEVRPRLFKPFVQADSSITRKFGGTGLGLAISQRLVALMGGNLDFESEPGKGTTFQFSLPLEAAPPQFEEGPEKNRLRGFRALVVDDNPQNRRYFSSHLQFWGTECELAASPEEALEIIGKHPPFDFILFDGELRGSGAASFPKNALALKPGVPVVLLTSSTEPAGKTDLFAASASMPLRPSGLRQAILTALSADPPPEVGLKPESGPEPTALGVLLAEDNLANQRVMQLLLRNLGIQPIITNNGMEALEAVRAESFDIVFLDMQMPVLDGLSAAKKIRELFPAPGRRPYIVALTANAFKEDREACLAAGMDAYLPKPITLARLKTLLAEYKAWRV